jgi:hypothetical protein
MRLGRTVWFEAKGSIHIGRVVGIRSGEKTVGDLPEAATEDGLNVQVSTAGEIFWVTRGQAHRVRECSQIGAATVEVLQVPRRVNVDGEPLAGGADTADVGTT